MILRAIAIVTVTIAGLETAAIAASSVFQTDPYQSATDRGLVSLIRSAEFGEPNSDSRLTAWLKAHPHTSVEDRRMIDHRLCTDYQAHNNHASAAAACAAATDLGANDSQSAAINAKLRDLPAMRANGTTRVPLARNKLGSRDAQVEVNGVSSPWLVDTGAQMSVVSASLAKRIGVRILDGESRVGSTTGDVQGSVGVIASLRIGTASVENVPVLILPDAQLKIGDLPQIEAIFGLPIFVAFNRVAWLDGGTSLALGKMAPVPGNEAKRLYWHEEGVGIPIATTRGVMGAHLDTGANETTLRAAAHGLLDRGTEQTASSYTATVGGAAGVHKAVVRRYPRLTLFIAGMPVTLKNVKIDDTNHLSAARIGDDFLSRTDRMVLDFSDMKIDAVAMKKR